MTTLHGTLYTPGLIEDHGLKLRLGYQNQAPESYLFGSYLTFPRGFEQSRTEQLFTFQSDYVFPLAYPDWNILSLLYIKRFKSALFFDMASNWFHQDRQWVQKSLYSYGAEVTSDFHVAKSSFPFSAGLRFSYLPQFSDHQFEFIFGVDFYRIYSQTF